MEVQSQTVQLHLLGARKAPMNQDEFDTKFNYMKGTRNRRVSLESRQVDCCVCCRLNVKAPTRMPQTESDSYFPRGKNFLARYLPFTQWMTKYNIRQKFPGDLCAGITVGLHSVAQGYAFAFLAGLPPICGIYTAVFSALIYTFLGTSRLNFMGGNVVICFLTRNIVERISVPYDYIYLLPSNSTDIPKISGLEQIQIVSTLTFLTALIQACMYALRLDFLLFYLSQQVLSGFSFGLAIRIAMNQMQHVLHVKGNSCISELSLTVGQF
uniref:Sulfate_transp domain-containing protein n=1 Tax=Panagrellus redivivus TaxID=6233 RepID=A0A7E4ZPS0_PANRE